MCNVYVNAIKRREGHEKMLLQPLIEANNRHNIFAQNFMDMVLLGDTSYCEICKKSEDLMACNRCSVVYYCSPSHQQEHAKTHRTLCSDLADARNFLFAERNLKINKEKSWLGLQQTFDTAVCSWEEVWERLECVACSSDIFRRRMSESLSWALNVLQAIQRFKIVDKDSLLIHILGADDSYYKEGYFTYFPGFLPFPNVHFVLIGPDIIHKTSSLEYRSIHGSQIRLSRVSAVWHDYMDDNSDPSPDLVFAAHPGIQEEFYAWKPSIDLLISSCIPTVFTMWHREDFLVARNLLEDKYAAGIMFEGPTLFPSLVKRYARKSWNEYGVQTMNSYWIGFQGNIIL